MLFTKQLDVLSPLWGFRFVDVPVPGVSTPVCILSRLRRFSQDNNILLCALLWQIYPVWVRRLRSVELADLGSLMSKRYRDHSLIVHVLAIACSCTCNCMFMYLQLHVHVLSNYMTMLPARRDCVAGLIGCALSRSQSCLCPLVVGQSELSLQNCGLATSHVGWLVGRPL